MKKSRKGSSGTHKSSTTKSEKVQPTIEIKEPKPDPDDSYNSGFGSYLRSPEGLEMMKLFIVANSVLIICTMAWPNMKHIYGIIKEAITGVEYFGY